MYKKNLHIYFLLFASLTLFTNSGFAATGTGNGAATIVTPLTVTEVSGAKLQFGNIDATGTGTVSVDAAGVRSKSGTVSLVSGATPSADAFTIAGAANGAVSVALPSSAVPLTLSGGSATMNITGFVSDVSGGNGNLDSSGALTFHVGGTLAVTSGQAPGLYTGTYTVTVQYQ